MEEMLNQIVVIDVESLFVYVGELTGIGHKSLTLEMADVHDLRDSNTTRERYLLDTRLHGVRANRKKVHVSQNQVISVSLLEDILE